MTTSITKGVLEALDQRRRQRKISRAKWLRAASVAESTWYRWTAGKTTPTFRSLERLESALGDGR